MSKSISGWFLVLVAITSCQSGARAQQNLTSAATSVRTSRRSSLQSGAASTQGASQRYVIKRGDTVSLSFDLATELNQTLLIEPDGYINPRSAPAIHAEGMTVAELSAAVKQAYAPVLSSDSIITVDVPSFLKPYFTVSGQVNKPGQYELRADTSVAEAIAIAGGLMPTAKTQILFFHKQSDQWFRVDKVNLQKVLTGKRPDLDAQVQSGDMIFIPEKAITNFRKYVPYSFALSTYAQQTPY
jgi:polysaccharide export outer membrane protein